MLKISSLFTGTQLKWTLTLLRPATILHLRATPQPSFTLLGSALRRKMPLRHTKKALATTSGRGGKQLANYHSLIRCDVLLPTPPCRLYNYRLYNFFKWTLKLLFQPLMVFWEYIVEFRKKGKKTKPKNKQLGHINIIIIF